MNVVIGCITYERPDGLRRLLKGVSKLRFDKVAKPNVTMLVVNNAPHCPIDEVIDAFRPDFPWQLEVDSEPARGLSNARNRVLSLLPKDADALAFIDDDEVPSPAWLDELLHQMETTGASIVQGPVKPFFLSPPPAWVIEGRFFENGPYEDGAPLHYAATNNSLIDAAVLRDVGLRFDRRFNRTGGEDQFFFGQVIKAGHSVVTSAHATVTEWIPEDRVRVGYLLKRKFRMGNTLTMIDRIGQARWWRPIRIAKACGKMALGLTQLVIRLPKGRAGVVEGLMNIAWGAGSIAGLFGVIHHEYDKLSPSAGVAAAPAPLKGH